MTDVALDQGQASHEAEPNTEHQLRRRLARKGLDGRTYEVLAARRGIMMRSDAVGGGAAAGDTIAGAVAGFVLDLLASLVLTAILHSAAESRDWKVKVYRLRGPFSRRIHSEVLAGGVDPDARMLELLEWHAPSAIA